jgi:hypothetical protein
MPRIVNVADIIRRRLETARRQRSQLDREIAALENAQKSLAKAPRRRRTTKR